MMWQKLCLASVFTWFMAFSAPSDAGLEEGIAATNAGQFEVAYREFSYLADMGFAPGMYELAKLYLDGSGVPKNTDKGVALLEQAIKLGNPDAMFKLAVLYKEGRGVVPDKLKAVELFTQAAHKNLPAAQYNLGVTFAEGEVVKQDYFQARYWYERAAANNYTLAMYNLALLYYEGLGTAKNIERSYVWNLMAEFNGYKPATDSRRLDEKSLSDVQKDRGLKLANQIYQKIQMGTYIAGNGFTN